MIRRLICSMLALLVALSPMTADAQVANAAAAQRVLTLITSIVANKAMERNLPAGDPRILATNQGVKDAAYAVAAAAVSAVLVPAVIGAVGAVSAPVWASVALSLGVGAVITWGLNSDTKFTFSNPIGYQVASPSAVGSASLGPGLVAGGNYYTTPSGYYTAGSVDGIAQSMCNQKMIEFAGYAVTCNVTSTDLGNGSFQIGIRYIYADCNCSIFNQGETAVFHPSYSGTACPAGQALVGGSQGGCADATKPSAGGPALPPQSAGVAMGALTGGPGNKVLTDAQLAEPANEELLAEMVNKLWEKAATTPGYTGQPFSYDNPVTAANVHAVAVSNPAGYPTVKDLMTPAVSAGTQAGGAAGLTSGAAGANGVVGALPTGSVGAAGGIGTGATSGVGAGGVTGTGTTTTTGATGSAAGAKLDLGVDPQIGPSYESVTGDLGNLLGQQLSSTTGLFVNTGGMFQGGACPTWSFPFFGKQVVMDSHCALFEAARTPLGHLSMGTWWLLCLFIVLGA